MNIYNFWLGDSSKKEEIRKKYIGLKGANLIIGPSKIDHDILMKKYKFYQVAIEKKIFSFASDIWRAWVIQKYGDGLYVDTSVDIEIKTLNKYIKKIKESSYQFIGFLENPTKIASCVFYSKSSSKILEDYLYYYSTYRHFIKLFKIAPEILTKSVSINSGHASSTIEVTYEDTKLWTLKEIVNEDGITGIRKYGYGSWAGNTQSKEIRAQYWIRKAKQFDTGFTQKEIKHYIKSDLKRGLWKLRNR